MIPKSDYDYGWKEIMIKRLDLMILFLFRKIYQQIYWSRGYEFLDKELRQVAPEGEFGRRYADKLVKVWLLNGQETWILIHIEVQSQYEQDFEERMYIYNSRLYNQYHHPVASLVILGDERPNWRPHRYESEVLGCCATLEFPVVKLLDYQDKLAELEQDPNPFAWVVRVHLRSKATQGKWATRRREKMQLARLLFQRGYSREEVIDLFRFLSWVFRLPKPLENEFRQELEAYQEETAMVYLTSYDELLIEEGIERGIEQGIEQGKRLATLALVQRQLTRRFGELSPETLSQIESLSGEKLESLSEDLLEFQEGEDLMNWLSQNWEN